MSKEAKKKTNRLIHETSPYLLQHAHNPVDWYGWGDEAKARAKRENKPIFLSVGYSACHWCHVMERESFEDEATAEILNANFVNIKVDREERPDVDAIYMSAVQAMTRHGGWPMSVFLTPELKPFYGGTYFPPQDRGGMPSFKKVLLGVANAWTNKRDEVMASAEEFTAALRAITEGQLENGDEPSLALFEEAIKQLSHIYDPDYGGFGKAPKFFHTMDLRLCLRVWKSKGDMMALEMVTKTLDKISRGGIYDHLGGGFHRYSTDAAWLVPHFEKMLYDNALLTLTFVEAYQATRNSNYAQVIRETLEYVQREMTGPAGEFFSTQDADTEGEEGKFYVWDHAEIVGLMGQDEGNRFCQVFGVRPSGNWEGKSILNQRSALKDLAREWEWDISTLQRKVVEWKKVLYQKRAERVAPFCDKKVLVSWNALMITAFAKGYQLFADSTYLESAQNSAKFIKEKLWQHGDSKGLLHCYKDGQSRFNAYLDDYANLIDALVCLYESDFDPDWLKWAGELSDHMCDHFWDSQANSFYYTSKDHEKMVARTRDYQDGATPSANSMAATALLKLGRLTSNEDYMEKGRAILKSFEPLMRQHPMAAGQLLVAFDLNSVEPLEVVVTEGEDREVMLSTLRQCFLPGALFADAKTKLQLTEDKGPIDNSATVYLCKNYACEAPISKLETLKDRCQTL